MLWAYALGVCFGHMHWAYALGICIGRMLWACVLGVCFRRMFWPYVLGVCFGRVTGLFLFNENTVGQAIGLLALVLREASRDRR